MHGTHPARPPRNFLAEIGHHRPTPIPRPYLYSGILFFASLGAYASSQQAFDILLLIVFGLVGFMMRRFALPVLPLIIGVILGPMMETRFREALAISGGDLGGLFNENLAIVVYVIAALVVVVPLVLRRVRTPGEAVENEHKELVDR